MKRWGSISRVAVTAHTLDYGSKLALPAVAASKELIADVLAKSDRADLLIIRDVSQRSVALSSSDPWLSYADILARSLNCNVLTVAHTGGSNREVPDAAHFTQVWKLSEGHEYRDGVLRERNGHELTLRQPGKPNLSFRSVSHPSFQTLNLVSDEGIAS